MKLAVAVLCTLCVAFVKSQGLQEMALLSTMLNRGGSSSSSGGNPLASLTGSSSSSTNPLAALAGSSSGSSGNPLAALASSGSASSNPLASIFGGSGMGRMAGGMMLGGAEMNNLMDFYMCGSMRIPMQICFMLMQQNM